MTEQQENVRGRGRRRRVMGRVVSTKMQKTIVVREERRIAHPRYEKIVSRFTRYKAHDERGEAREGDTVEIIESRPMSRTKAWRLVRIVRRAVGVEAGEPAGT